MLVSPALTARCTQEGTSVAESEKEWDGKVKLEVVRALSLQ